jgi:hypothetical protein
MFFSRRTPYLYLAIFAKFYQVENFLGQGRYSHLGRKDRGRRAGSDCHRIKRGDNRRIAMANRGNRFPPRPISTVSKWFGATLRVLIPTNSKSAESGIQDRELL